MSRLVKIAALALLLCACGDSKPSDVGELCSSVAGPVCQRINQCQPVDQTECFSVFMGGCCINDRVCGDELRDGVTFDDVDRCIADLANFNCSNLLAGQLPPSCLSM